MSVSPFIQSEHTHAPDGGKKKKCPKCCIPEVLLGVLLNDIQIPFPQR